ncbi:MAG: Ca2+-dependent phosphoinositide-specific phospholipase C [Crocinitomicaceae bacterium]
MIRFFVFSCWFFCFAYLYGQFPSDDTPLNEIRILASHNSYKKKPHHKVLRFLKKFQGRLGEQNNPDYIDYEHLPFSEQFNNYGIRGIELDVNYDPKGGHYKRRRVNLFLLGRRQRLKGGELKKPGFKILHISDVDFETNYLTLKSALNDLKTWSEAHSRHLPIYVNIEAKGSHPADESKSLKRLGFQTCIPFDSIAYVSLESEISSVLNPNQIYSPKHFRDTCLSLRSRINTLGWPTLKEARGKFIFVLEGSNQHVYKSFIDPLMFYYGDINDKNTAFLLRNDPVASSAEIHDLAKHFMIRTRSDSGTRESRENNYHTWESALKSHAQIISTDYYKADSRFSSYSVGFPNGLFELINP